MKRTIMVGVIAALVLTAAACTPSVTVETWAGEELINF